MITLLIATRNAHKAEEISAILGHDFRCLTLNEFPNAPEVIEDQPTFAGNAAKKAIELAEWLCSLSPTGAEAGQSLQDPHRVSRFTFHVSAPTFVLADDSGLEADALNGAPGVFSARFAALDTGAAGNSPTSHNNAKLLRLLAEVPLEQRTARFRCVMALTPLFTPDKTGSASSSATNTVASRTELFEGACEGKIGFGPQGQGGFGYDPLFIPEGHARTFAELGEDVKNRLSHRAKALHKLRKRLAALISQSGSA